MPGTSAPSETITSSWQPHLDVPPAHLPTILAFGRPWVASWHDVAILGADAFVEIKARLGDALTRIGPGQQASTIDRQFMADLIGGSFVPPEAFDVPSYRQDAMPALRPVVLYMLGMVPTGLNPSQSGDHLLAEAAFHHLVASALVVLTARGQTDELITHSHRDVGNMLRSCVRWYEEAKLAGTAL